MHKRDSKTLGNKKYSLKKYWVHQVKEAHTEIFIKNSFCISSVQMVNLKKKIFFSKYFKESKFFSFSHLSSNIDLSVTWYIKITLFNIKKTNKKSNVRLNKKQRKKLCKQTEYYMFCKQGGRFFFCPWSQLCLEQCCATVEGE